MNTSEMACKWAQNNRAWFLPALFLLVSAATAQAGDFSYTTNSDNTITITRYKGLGGNVIIPDKVNDRPVTIIQAYAFQSCFGVTNVTIPNSVTVIGYGAFNACTGLVSIAIGNSVTTIGVQAFRDCYGLTSVTIPNSVTSIGGGAFEICTSLTCVIIGNRVTTIGYEAFYGCGGLTSVTIPNSVTNIDTYGFGYCYSLKSVYFEGNAPSVGLDAFFGGAKIYYLLGTAGWPTVPGKWADRPTALWNPQVQSDASFGVRTNKFGFYFIWTNAIGRTLGVEACTNLLNPAWSPAGTFTLTGGTAYFGDPQWTNHATRFYRLRAP